MPLELGQEPLDRHGHELGAAEAGHVAEDVSRVEPLSGDVEIQRLDEAGGDLLEDACGEVVLSEQLLVAFEGARAVLGAGLAIQGILDIGAEDVGLDGLLGVPAEEVGEGNEPGHGVELLVGAEGVAEMSSEYGDGHDLKEDVAKEALPAVGDDPPPQRWDDAVEGVEAAILSGIDGRDHGGRDSLSKRYLSRESHAGLSRKKQP